MLSYLGSAAEVTHTHSQDCKQIDGNHLVSHICSAFCPVTISQSMSYIASALSPRPASAESMVSLPSTQSSILERSTPEELSDGEHDANDTRATSVTTEPTRKQTSTSSTKIAAKAVFHLAHPPPVSIHKQHLHIRPRVLLQLQRVSETARPTPVLEVLPSFVFASRLARRFPRTFKGKAGLGADDLVVVGSEDYKTQGSETGELDGIFEGDRWDNREIVAAICQSSKDEVGNQKQAEICVSNGPSWAASRLGSGAYEFVSVDEHGLRTVGRWVPKQAKAAQRTSTVGRDRSNLEERKFNFSLLNPSSRRHAIIASMDRHSIEVCGHYTEPSLVHRDTASSAPAPSTSSNPEEHLPKDPIEVTQSLKTLIIVTGIFVSFREGFSSLFTHSDSPTSPNFGSKHPHRSWSLSSNQQFGKEQSRSPTASTFGNVQRARPKLQHTHSTFERTLSNNSISPKIPGPRATSSGVTFMQRIRSRNSSAIKGNQLSPIGGLDDSDTERTLTGRESGRASRASSLYSEATSAGVEEGQALETVPSSDLDVVDEHRAVTPAVTKKPRKLSRMFGLSSRVKRNPENAMLR